VSVVAKLSPMSVTAEHLFSDAEDLGETQMESPPTEAPNAGAVAANWRFSTRSVVNSSFASSSH